MSEELIQLINANNATLTIIAEQLQELVQLQRQNLYRETGPNFRRSLAEYAAFNWFSIEANPVREASDGINEVDWGGYTWRRRSGTGKFGNAIWFSRAIGRNEDNTPKYARLITFKDNDDPEPLQVNVEPGLQEHSQPPQDPPPMTEAEAVGAAMQAGAPPTPTMTEAEAHQAWRDQVGPAIRGGIINASEASRMASKATHSGWINAIQALQQRGSMVAA
ncbi:hypothetical protein LCGC14_1211960 [marine sediment metagenome]|uniref:Uncharacterized protein n=1 Tax=marine sediment metagenome TaxID=412755 RepID=A0A0F9NW36_9ZZZZ